MARTPPHVLGLTPARMSLVLLAVLVTGAAVAAAIGVGGKSHQVTVPAGTAIVGALDGTVTTEHARVGDDVALDTREPVALGGGATLPAGATLHGEVTHVRGGGRVAGAPELTLRFTELEVDGDRYRISADPFRLTGRSDARESVLEIAGGAVAGAVVGGIAGGGGGAAKGAAVGAVLGTGVAVATKGDQIVLPAGQALRIRLAEPVTVRVRE